MREAVISDFGNRYAEGWPGERVYAGCIDIDQVNIICNNLAKKVFRAEFADSRATSGVVANLAIYSAFSSPGDYMMVVLFPAEGIFLMERKNILVGRSCSWTIYRTLSLFKGRNDNRCGCHKKENSTDER